MAERVNLKDVLRTLELGRIHLLQRSDDVVAILGKPDCVGGASRKHCWPAIWKYGDIELLFDYRTREIEMILINFWDSTTYPSGGAAIQLDPWIIKGGLGLDELIPQLDKEGIDYCEVEPPNPGTRHLLVSSAITMIFNNDPSDEFTGAPGLRKFLLNRPRQPQPLLNLSLDAAKDSTA
jgi:hypothetical protein